MKKNILLILLTLVFITHHSYAKSFKADEQYSVLKEPLSTEVAEAKIEVRELFWYYCPHCANLEPILNQWLTKKDDSVQFVRQPAVFSQRWLSGAIFYYVLEELDAIDLLHQKLFDAIHQNNIIINGKEDFVDWLNLQGINRERASKAFSSFSIRTKVNRSTLSSKKYQVQGVPSFIINGKYTTGVKQAGSEKTMFEVIDYLVKKEKNLIKSLQ